MSVAIGTPHELFDLASRTHPGMVREANEDHCATFCDEQCAGLVVADGVSGLHGGGTASRMAVDVTLEAFHSEAPSVRPAKRLFQAVQRANITVHDRALRDPELRSMATTLTAALLVQNDLYVAHIGDCRLYLLRDGELSQLTRDHTVSAERVRLGILSKSKARNHPARSTLTRGLGRELIARIDQLSTRIIERDVLLVCSDGIHAVLDDAELAHLCRGASADDICNDLIEAANRYGSPDNVSVAVARVQGKLPAVPPRWSLFQTIKRTFQSRAD